MAVSASTLRRLAALNLSSEQMSGVLELLADAEDAEEERRAKARERKARQRGASRDSHGTVTGRGCDMDRDKESSPCTPSKKNTPLKSPKGDYSPRKRDVEEAFDRFWAVYPKRVEKQGALRKFEAACRKVDPERVVEGAKAYAQHLRETESLDFCKHPTTWLNNGCWDDEYGVGNNSPGGWSEAAWRGACKAWKRGEGWPDGAGDPPDMATTNVPPEILQELEIR